MTVSVALVFERSSVGLWVRSLRYRLHCPRRAIDTQSTGVMCSTVTVGRNDATASRAHVEWSRACSAGARQYGGSVGSGERVCAITDVRGEGRRNTKQQLPTAVALSAGRRLRRVSVCRAFHVINRTKNGFILRRQRVYQPQPLPLVLVVATGPLSSATS